MRVLEARFHPKQKAADDFIVVGHVVWEGARRPPVIQPTPDLFSTLPERARPADLLSKLRYLVDVVGGPESFERLQLLPSQFWSFVQAPTPWPDPRSSVKASLP